MTRKEKIEQVLNKCRTTSDFGECKLYRRAVACPVQLHVRGLHLSNNTVEWIYKLLKEEMKNAKQEEQEMTREEKVIVEEGIMPYCPNCGSSEWLHNEDENRNDYCGQCGIKLDWTDVKDGYKKTEIDETKIREQIKLNNREIREKTTEIKVIKGKLEVLLEMRDKLESLLD